MKRQRGIVGADLTSILAKRNQSAQIRTAQRTAAIQKAKTDKKEKEAKKTKVQFRRSPHRIARVNSMYEDLPASGHYGTQDLKAPGEGWKEWPLVNGSDMPDFSYVVDVYSPHHAKYIHLYKRSPFTVNPMNINETYVTLTRYGKLHDVVYTTHPRLVSRLQRSLR